MTRVIPRQWVDMKTGELTREALLYLNDLDNNTDTGVTSIGTRLSGVAQKADGIIAGTIPLDDVTISGRGKITAEFDALNTNVNSASTAASSGALTATISPGFAGGSEPVAGTVTTNSVTVTPSGGTSPYTYAWTKVSGDTFTVTSPTAAATTFSVTLGSGGLASAIYRCTVTDDASATYTVDVSVLANITDIVI
jgi:hypothetical protein